MPRPLQTTHYALLALLGIRPWAAYELVGQMSRSVGAVWPRAQSNLYADLKRLAAEGWTKATVESVGQGARTTHRITRKGRAALRAWLATPGAAPTFESEALLKLGFAPFTTKTAALAQIDVIAGHARQRLEIGTRLARDYVDGTGPMPERFHVSAVMWRFLWDFHHAMNDWATWARHEVEAWPDTLDSPAMRARGLRVLGDALARQNRT